MWDATAVCRAIELEREVARHPIPFRVIETKSLGSGVVEVQVEPVKDRHNRPLDDALEGARAWWPGNPPGTADVLTVDTESNKIALRFVKGALPSTESGLMLYEPDYYEALAGLWSQPDLQRRALAKRPSHAGAAPLRNTKPLPGIPLREHQKSALHLAHQPIGLLHGPPGTGKTTTLGALVADQVVNYAPRSVLIVATTNTATDQALLSIDEALHRAGAEQIRRRCKRIGSRIDAKRYVGREHLLPVADVALFDRLVEVESREPDKGNLIAWASWKTEIEAIRAKLKVRVEELVHANAVIAITATAATFWFETLRLRGFDLLVVDEASQLGGASALMLASLAKRTLFAGDPQQLAAVVRSSHPDPKRYLGSTAFDLYKGMPNVFLNEQSRMARPICDVVSKVFYGGKLVVAADAEQNPAWKQSRTPLFIEGKKQRQVRVDLVDAEATWSQKYRGFIRYNSATHVANVIDGLLGANVAHEDIVVLTPFRAQRALLRNMLRAKDLKRIKVSTVHRAQGSERPVVIFDPVDGAGDFLKGADGDRLINVAISRAQTQVVIALSQKDRENRTLDQIARMAGSAGSAEAKKVAKVAPTVREYLNRPNFPNCLLQQTIRVNDVVGKVIALEKGGKTIVVEALSDGQHRKFSVPHIVAMASQAQ